MLNKCLFIAAAANLVAVLLFVPPGAMAAEPPNSIALTGMVSSNVEGPMEGVRISAKRSGSTITTTVVTDAKGRYRFPPAKLEPGVYALRVRAAGYDLDDSGQVEITAQPKEKDLRLRPTTNLAAQLTNAEWMMSIPGTEQQKAALLNCVNCHSLQRIVSSHHGAAEFVKVLQRMASYANQSTPLHPQKRVAYRLLEERGDQLQASQRKLAEYLSSINLSSVTQWQYALKTLSRPKGRDTRVVITEYDLPRQTIEPHDVIADSQGMVWYSNFGEQFIGRLDPKTGEHTEYPVPQLKKGHPTGVLGLRPDKDGNLWMGMMFQAAIAKFDRKAEKFQVFSLPPELNHDVTQVNMASPQQYAVDGKVWMQNNGFAAVHRVDIASGKFDDFEPFKDSKPGENHNIYDVVPDSHNNAYFTDFANGQIGRIDAKTGQISFFQTPTPRSAPRRGMMDSQDRLWFGEYRANRIAMFNTRTERFQEWLAPTPNSAPYDVAVDKNGDAWTGSMVTDRVLRLNPMNGEFTEYLLPRSTNIRRVSVDNSTTPVTFWVGNNHGASIVKLEPLD